MELHLIKTERHHRWALRRDRAAMAGQPGTAEHDRLETLGFLVSGYEERSWPVAAG